MFFARRHLIKTPFSFQLKRLVKWYLAQFGYEIRKRAVVYVARIPQEPFQAQRQLLHGLGISRPIVIDVGANMGQSVDSYRAVFPEAHFYCFEPFPTSYLRLKERFEADPRVQLYPLALSRSPGENTLFLGRHIQTHSLRRRPDQERRYYAKAAAPADQMLQVNSTTLDDFVKSENLRRMDILKLDVQGSEIDVLRGAEQALRALNPALLFIETPFVPHYQGEALFHQIWDFLATFGYSIFDLYHLNRASNGQLRYANSLFVSAEMRSQVIDTFPQEP